MIKNLWNRVRWALSTRVMEYWQLALLALDWARYKNRRAAPLAGLVVSLTSYPPRFVTLHRTLKSLLVQSVTPEKLVLWVAHKDEPLLPPSVRELVAYGLEICTCDDLRSFKKLVPEWRRNPTATIVTADDDIHYWRDWLKELVDAQTPGVKQVVCHRLHRIRLDADGLPVHYVDWQHEANLSSPDVLNFPTGIGGVLYPAGLFDERVLDEQTFMRLCPKGDDIWFYWLARTNGALFRHVGPVHHLYSWRCSQDAALWNENMAGNYNDVQIGAMIDAFGFFGAPARAPAPVAVANL